MVIVLVGGVVTCLNVELCGIIKSIELVFWHINLHERKILLMSREELNLGTGKLDIVLAVYWATEKYNGWS